MQSESERKHLVDGYVAGLSQGRFEGQLAATVDTVIRLLELKFGPLPRERRAFLENSNVAELDFWLARLLDATSLDGVFGSETAPDEFRGERVARGDAGTDASQKRLDREEGETFARQYAARANRGKALVLTRLLTRKFDGVPLAIDARLHAASAEELDLWTERVVGANSLEEVFRKAEGEVKGRDAGNRKPELAGEARALLLQLEHRFGRVPEEIAERVSNATVEQLDRWLDRVVGAGSLEEIFREA